MRSIPSHLLPLAALLCMAVAGCHDDHSHDKVFISPPTPLPPPPPAQQVVIIPTAPPPPVREARPMSPTPGYAWVGGVWIWDGQRYLWQTGHWERIPQGYARWIEPHYEHREKGYHYQPGHWER